MRMKSRAKHMKKRREQVLADQRREREAVLALSGQHVFHDLSPSLYWPESVDLEATVCIICGMVRQEDTNRPEFASCTTWLALPESRRSQTGVGHWDVHNMTWKGVWKRLREEYGHA